ncbi:MAG: FprA family A-type flavoprotein [Prevotella sp.]|nr:FprA family A-type flavoprotein [Prevotella sp.]MCM1075301.1 FprA family A-type flavoprotein [Ruminococcus sp.]
MNIPQITKNVYYTGVDDLTTYRFEGLWALPYGVSYNSYIVHAEKTALIDGVEIKKLEELLRSIDGTDLKPDYLIINHMEPDHSGAIPGLIDHYPELKIVGNAKTVDMIRGFYHIQDDQRFIIVKDGDTLNLGNDCVLKFFLTPMLHWPETMMTYLESNEILFSGDAFGTFGALNGAVVDNDIADVNVYFDEMYRYYAAIVAKYGRFVQTALFKLSALKISYIASTHGPVWHDKAEEAVNAYSRLSSSDTKSGVVIAYGSMYGNTAMLVDTIARRLHEKGVVHVHIYNLSTSEQSRVLADIWKYKGLIIASPTYNNNIYPPVESLLKALEVRELKAHTVGIVGSYAWAPAAMRLIKERVEAINLPVVGTVAMKMSPDEESQTQAIALADVMADAILC